MVQESIEVVQGPHLSDLEHLHGPLLALLVGAGDGPGAVTVADERRCSSELETRTSTTQRQGHEQRGMQSKLCS